MSDTIPVSVHPAVADQEPCSSKSDNVGGGVETTADMSCIMSDQSRYDNEEIDFEVQIF